MARVKKVKHAQRFFNSCRFVTISCRLSAIVSVRQSAANVKLSGSRATVESETWFYAGAVLDFRFVCSLILMLAFLQIG